MSFFDDLIAASSLSEARATIVGYAQAALLPVTSWIVGSVGQQVLEVCTQIAYVAEQARVQLTRGFASLDTSTDPGDVDAFNPSNVDLTPAPGFLSNLGRNFYGTVRIEETFATGFVTFTNAGPSARTFKPYALVFTWTLNTPPTPRPTYRNSADDSVYTNPDGSVTVLANTSITIPVVAEDSGTGSNTPAASLTLTTTLLGCTATNGSAVLAVDRENADLYRARCRKAPARLSFAGPEDAVSYLATTTLDGEPLLNASGNPVNITRASVTNDSDTGIVNAYYASASGPAAAEDVAAANENIEVNAYAVCDCATFTGATAVAKNIVIEGTAKIKARTGLDTESYIEGKIAEAVVAAFSALSIGGNDPVAGVGKVYHVDIIVAAANAYVGLYNVQLALPTGASTNLDEDEVAVPVTVSTDWTVTIVP